MAGNTREQLSSWMDDSTPDATTLQQLLRDAEMQQQYSRYRLIGDSMRGELQGSLQLDLSDRVMAALADEPTVLAPKPQIASLWQRRVVPMVRQTAQFAVAASVAAVVVFGVQQYNQPGSANPSPVLSTRPVGGMAAPVSLSTSSLSAEASAQAAMEQRRRINAYLKDHQQQVRFDVEQPRLAESDPQQ